MKNYDLTKIIITATTRAIHIKEWCRDVLPQHYELHIKKRSTKNIAFDVFVKNLKTYIANEYVLQIDDALKYDKDNDILSVGKDILDTIPAEDLPALIDKSKRKTSSKRPKKSEIISGIRNSN